MKINIITDIEFMPFPSRLQYAIDRIMEHPLFPKDVVFTINDQGEYNHTLSYSSTFHENKKFILRQDFLFHKKRISDHRNLYHNSNIGWVKPLYSVASRHNNELTISDHCIAFDLFETIFFHLSRIEECTWKRQEHVENIDDFEKELLTVRSNTFQIPIVDDLIRFFGEWLTGRKIHRTSELAITHDVDILPKWKHPWSIIRKTGGHILHRKSVKGFPLLFKQWINFILTGLEPYDTFSWLLSEREFSSKEIYFLAGGQHKLDTPFPLDDPIFKNAIKWALDKGYKPGIHPSFESWKDRGRIHSEKEILENAINIPVKLSRQHFLNFDVMETPHALISCGISKDSSLGFSRRNGFRCGTGFDYFLYDFKNEKTLSLLESPLIFMDSACLHESYYNSEVFIKIMTDFFEANKYNTRIVCNFHNSFIDEATMRSIPLKEMLIKIYDSWPISS